MGSLIPRTVVLLLLSKVLATPNARAGCVLNSSRVKLTQSDIWQFLPEVTRSTGLTVPTNPLMIGKLADVCLPALMDNQAPVCDDYA